MFDEQPDGDPHGECAEEIARLNAELDKCVAATAEIERLRTENTAWINYVQSMSAGAIPVVAIAPTTGQATIVLVTPNEALLRDASGLIVGVPG